MYEIKNGRPYYFALKAMIYSYNIPRKFEESYLKMFWIKYIVLKLYCVMVACVMPLLHFTMSLKDKTGVPVSEDLTVTLSEMGWNLSFILFNVRYKKWAEFFTEVTDIKKFDPSANVEKFARKSNRFSAIFCCYVLSGLLLYGIISVKESSACKQLNEEKGLHEACIVYYSVWLGPYDANDVLSTVIIYTMQVFEHIHVLPPTAMLFCVVMESTELLIWHINILKQRFISLFEETSGQEISAKLRFCINYHNYILRLGTRLNSLQKFTMGHMSCIAAIVFGCILNQISQNIKPIAAAVHLLGCITVIALMCHSGQRITDQSSSIADAVFASDWVKADPQTKKDLAFIILRCQTPIYFNCIPLGIWNYTLFVGILKASYSYLTLLDGAT